LLVSFLGERSFALVNLLRKAALPREPLGIRGQVLLVSFLGERSFALVNLLRKAALPREPLGDGGCPAE